VAEELNRRGHRIDPDTAGRLLKSGGFSLQANVKTKEGGRAPERDVQFRYINEQAKKFMAQADPVISVVISRNTFVYFGRCHYRQIMGEASAKNPSVFCAGSPYL